MDKDHVNRLTQRILMSNLPNSCIQKECGVGCRSKLSGCAVCGISGQLLRCSRCKNILYCSSEHQKLDWKRHKKQCKKLTNNQDKSKLDPVLADVNQSKGELTGK